MSAPVSGYATDRESDHPLESDPKKIRKGSEKETTEVGTRDVLQGGHPEENK